MELSLNTADTEVISVSLVKDGQAVETLQDKNKFGSQALLPLIKKILDSQGLSLEDLKGIKTSTGPGSFTGLRVGLAVANSLGFSLNIPVNGKKLETEITY